MAASSGSEWAARMQKRRNFELTLLRQPSETESQRLSESTQSHSSSSSTTTPASPSSNHSTKTSHSLDQLQALQLQLERNAAQMRANETRMRELEVTDLRMGGQIQERLSTVSQLNSQLNVLREMLARAERVSRGEFGLMSKGG